MTDIEQARAKRIRAEDARLSKLVFETAGTLLSTMQHLDRGTQIVSLVLAAFALADAQGIERAHVLAECQKLLGHLGEMEIVDA
jgi:hypothetical protein